jgi:hypothetical protein
MAAGKNSTTTTFNFIRRQGRHERLVAEVEIVLGEDAGILSGMKLVGGCIWRSDVGQLFVTLPSKAGKSGRYFEYLRPATPGNGAVKALKEEVLRQWEVMHLAEVSVA